MQKILVSYLIGIENEEKNEIVGRDIVLTTTDEFAADIISSKNINQATEVLRDILRKITFLQGYDFLAIESCRRI